MKDLFIPYELSVIAKEKAFDEKCFAYYRKQGNLSYFNPKSIVGGNIDIYTNGQSSGFIKAPLYQQIIDWFREKHNVKIIENPNFDWEVWGAYDDRFIQLKFYLNLDEAITEAFKLI